MPANPIAERRDLLYVLAQANPRELLVRVATTGSLQLTALDSEGQPLTVALQPSTNGQSRIYDLLLSAPVGSWRASKSLREAVSRGWLFVDVTLEAAPPTNPIVVEAATPIESGIPPPSNAQIGDLLMFDGTQWGRLSPGAASTYLRSNGSGVPTWAAVTGTGAGSLTEQVTAGLTAGNVVYLSGAATWTKARSDSGRALAYVAGVYGGESGTIQLAGNAVSVLFTTAGGSPSVGSDVFLAASSDDTGSGAGKLTATAPSSGYLTRAGVCVNNASYAGAKTSLIVFTPDDPILL